MTSARRLASVVYAPAACAVSLAAGVYLVAFVGDVRVPRTIDRGLDGGATPALCVDAALLVLFAFQHSVMARRSFKQGLARRLPEPFQRSTYLLATAASLALFMARWRPIPTIVWEVRWAPTRLFLSALFWAGWALLLWSSLLLDPWDLLGLRQVSDWLRGRRAAPVPFRRPWLYRQVRHPTYLGFLIAFWSTPRMTAGHLLFAAGMTAYLLAAIHFEERDLVAAFGPAYRAYRRRVPALIPLSRRRRRPRARGPSPS